SGIPFHTTDERVDLQSSALRAPEIALEIRSQVDFRLEEYLFRRMPNMRGSRAVWRLLPMGDETAQQTHPPGFARRLTKWLAFDLRKLPKSCAGSKKASSPSCASTHSCLDACQTVDWFI